MNETKEGLEDVTSHVPAKPVGANESQQNENRLSENRLREIEKDNRELFEMSAQDAFEGDFEFESAPSSLREISAQALDLPPIPGSVAVAESVSDLVSVINTDLVLESVSISVSGSPDLHSLAEGDFNGSKESFETVIPNELAIDTLSLQSASLVEESSDLEENRETAIDLGEIARSIPNKMAFKIGEVAEITDLKPYVLRYWESEFEALNPQKSAFNQRMYSRRDVETVLLIKKLLYEEKFSIAGAKRKLKEMRRELKTEKHWLEINERIELATDRVGELIDEISSLRKIFV